MALKQASRKMMQSAQTIEPGSTIGRVTQPESNMKLNVGWDEHYKIPALQHPGLSEMDLGRHHLAVHHAPLSRGRSIDFYAKLEPSDTLFVSFHGAVPLASPRYPHFRRVESMKNRVPALLCIADPTLRLVDDAEFRLGWYTGGEAWDPLQELAGLVRQAQARVGARRVMFLGSSGGGFASLRMSVLFPGSLAFVQDPQTDVGAYYAGHRDRLIRSTWPSWDNTSAFAQNSDRFDMLHLYSSTNPDNYIYYRQATSDEWHLRNHAEPFRKALVGTSGSRTGRYRFVYEPGEKPGHGKITPAEFDRHLKEALVFWDEMAGS